MQAVTCHRAQAKGGIEDRLRLSQICRQQRDLLPAEGPVWRAGRYQRPVLDNLPLDEMWGSGQEFHEVISFPQEETISFAVCGMLPSNDPCQP